MRAGAPDDDEEDLAFPCWSGHLPLQLTAGAPVADERAASAALPPALAAYRR